MLRNDICVRDNNWPLLLFFLPLVFNVSSIIINPSLSRFHSKVFDTAHFVNSLYTWSAFNTEAVGHIIGHALVQLTSHINLNRIHLIGTCG